MATTAEPMAMDPAWPKMAVSWLRVDFPLPSSITSYEAASPHTG